MSDKIELVIGKVWACTVCSDQGSQTIKCVLICNNPWTETSVCPTLNYKTTAKWRQVKPSDIKIITPEEEDIR